MRAWTGNPVQVIPIVLLALLCTFGWGALARGRLAFCEWGYGFLGGVLLSKLSQAGRAR